MIDTIAISDTEDFRPRFDSIDKDFDRLIEKMADLRHQNRLAVQKGKSLMDLYGTATLHRMIDAYFDRKLYDSIERHYTWHELAFGAPDDGTRSAMERLVELGEGQRAIRIWRNYLAVLKSTYWWHLDERRQGLKTSPNWLEDEAVQRRSHDELIAKIPSMKTTLLMLFDDAQKLFLRAGATEGQLTRLARERAEVDAEERTPPAGKPDPRPMDDDLFWELIGVPCGSGLGERIEALADRLAHFNPAAIRKFDALLHDKSAEAYRSDIWALVYLLNDGCSDDDFAGFRCGLILLGREGFEAALANPDDFASVVGVTTPGNGLSLLNVPPLAHEMRTGKAMRRKSFKMPALKGPALEEEDFADYLPQVAEVTGHRP